MAVKKKASVKFDPNNLGEICKTSSVCISAKMRFGPEEIFMSETVEVLVPLDALELRKLKIFKYTQVRLDILKTAVLAGIITRESHDKVVAELEVVKTLFETS